MTTFLLLVLYCLTILIVIIAGTALLPAKRVMRTMPQELKEATKDHPLPPLWKRVIGSSILVCGIGVVLWIFLYAGYEGVEQGWGFWKIFVRYMIIFYGFKLFDIVCLDWWLITKSHFFQHFYPETEGSKGYDSFGFNKKEQLTRIIAFPFISAIISALWVWLS